MPQTKCIPAEKRKKALAILQLFFKLKIIPFPVAHRIEMSSFLTCSFRTCQKKEAEWLCCACWPPEGPELVAWGKTPQVDRAIITKETASVGGPFTMNVPGRMPSKQRRSKLLQIQNVCKLLFEEYSSFLSNNCIVNASTQPSIVAFTTALFQSV